VTTSPPTTPASAPGAGSSPLTVEIVETPEAFDALHDEWNAAALASVDANVFLTWEWLRTWWRHFGEGDTAARLHVVVLCDADGIVAAAPLFRLQRRSGPLRATTMQPIAYWAGDYGGIVLVRRFDEAVGLLVGHLERELRRDVSTVTFSRVASDSQFLASLRRLASSQQDGRLAFAEKVIDDSVCPYADVSDDGLDLGRRIKKNRVPQRLRRLEEKYDVELRYSTGADLAEGFGYLRDLHNRRWADRWDEFKGLLASESGAAFLFDAVRELDDRGWLRLLTLLADGHPVATRLDFEFGGRIFMLKNAIDPAFSEYGPGHITHHQVFEDGLARGVTQFDFLRGDHPYKRRWSNRERHLVTVTLSRSGLRGSLATARSRVTRRRRP
jgi:CelD/BcsL family acetyltransferase involved in cellulose biosynthesis